MKRIIVLINCPDKQGIIASVTSFIQQQSGNIVYIDQYVDSEDKMFFMRLECEFSKSIFSVEAFENNFRNTISTNFEMNWQLYDADIKFHVKVEPTQEAAGCICGEVMQGIAVPKECSLFGTICTPEDPVGACMVSSEGSCAASYKYEKL